MLLVGGCLMLLQILTPCSLRTHRSCLRGICRETSQAVVDATFKNSPYLDFMSRVMAGRCNVAGGALPDAVKIGAARHWSYTLCVAAKKAAESKRAVLVQTSACGSYIDLAPSE